MDAESGAERMNVLGSRQQPFFFLVDAWAQRWIVLEEHEAREMGICWELNRQGYFPTLPVPSTPLLFSFETVNPLRYSTAFAILRNGQIRGETWLANLTFPSRISTNFCLENIAGVAVAPFRLYIPNTVAVFSPERFIRIENSGRIAAFPMKGTIDTSIPNAEERILEDPKEAAEHVTIVDLIRNDIGIVADNVHVPHYRFISTVRTQEYLLLQVSSEVVGYLGSDWRRDIGEILKALLPAGSVTGAPKKRTGELIREAEQYNRGWYTGVFGYFNGWEIDSAVAIRFIEQESDKSLVYKSGGGITIYSNAEQEYTELKKKIYVPLG